MHPFHRLWQEVGRGMAKEIQAAVKANQTTFFLKKKIDMALSGGRTNPRATIWPEGGPWGALATPKAK